MEYWNCELDIHTAINHNSARHSAKAGIQKGTGFRVKPGMTNYIRLMSSCIIPKSLNPSIKVSSYAPSPFPSPPQTGERAGMSIGLFEDPLKVLFPVTLFVQKEIQIRGCCGYCWPFKLPWNCLRVAR